MNIVTDIVYTDFHIHISKVYTSNIGASANLGRSAWEKVPPSVRKGTSLEIWVVVTKWLPNCGLDMLICKHQLLGNKRMLTYHKISNFQNFILNIPSKLFFDGEALFLSYQRFLVNLNKPWAYSVKINQSNMNISGVSIVPTPLFSLSLSL